MGSPVAASLAKAFEVNKKAFISIQEVQSHDLLERLVANKMMVSEEDLLELGEDKKDCRSSSTEILFNYLIRKLSTHGADKGLFDFIITSIRECGNVSLANDIQKDFDELTGTTELLNTSIELFNDFYEMEDQAELADSGSPCRESEELVIAVEQPRCASSPICSQWETSFDQQAEEEEETQLLFAYDTAFEQKEKDVDQNSPTSTSSATAINATPVNSASDSTDSSKVQSVESLAVCNQSSVQSTEIMNKENDDYLLISTKNNEEAPKKAQSNEEKLENATTTRVDVDKCKDISNETLDIQVSGLSEQSTVEINSSMLDGDAEDEEAIMQAVEELEKQEMAKNDSQRDEDKETQVALDVGHDEDIILEKHIIRNDESDHEWEMDISGDETDVKLLKVVEPPKKRRKKSRNGDDCSSTNVKQETPVVDTSASSTSPSESDLSDEEPDEDYDEYLYSGEWLADFMVDYQDSFEFLRMRNGSNHRRLRRNAMPPGAQFEPPYIVKEHAEKLSIAQAIERQKRSIGLEEFYFHSTLQVTAIYFEGKDDLYYNGCPFQSPENITRCNRSTKPLPNSDEKFMCTQGHIVNKDVELPRLKLLLSDSSGEVKAVMWQGSVEVLLGVSFRTVMRSMDRDVIKRIVDSKIGNWYDMELRCKKGTGTWGSNTWEVSAALMSTAKEKVVPLALPAPAPMSSNSSSTTAPNNQQGQSSSTSTAFISRPQDQEQGPSRSTSTAQFAPSFSSCPNTKSRRPPFHF